MASDVTMKKLGLTLRCHTGLNQQPPVNYLNNKKKKKKIYNVHIVKH